MKSNPLLIRLFTLVVYLFVFSNQNQAQYYLKKEPPVAVSYANGKTYSIDIYHRQLYILDVDIDSRQGISTLLFERPADSLPAFMYDKKCPSLTIKKGIYSPIHTEKAVDINDILDMNTDKYIQAIKAFELSYIPTYKNYLSGYYDLKETPGIQCGTTCFIGTPDDIRKGNYAVFAINTCNTTKEAIYILAWYIKKHLSKVLLSNGATISNFNSDATQFKIYYKHVDKQHFTYAFYSDGNCTDGTTGNKQNSFGTKFSHGGTDLGYLYPKYKQTDFTLDFLVGKVYMCTDQIGNQSFYSFYGRPVSEGIQLISEKVKEPMVLNIAKFNDPNGETVVIGEKKPDIRAQDYIEFDRFRDITLNIPRYKDPEGIDLQFNDLVSRWVVLAQITSEGKIRRFVNKSDKFNYFTADARIYKGAFNNSPLHLAIAHKNTDSALFFIPGYASYKNSDGQTALHYAAYYNNIPIVNRLLENGAKVYERDLMGNTALHYAAAVGNNAMINRLCEAGKKEENEFITINNMNINRQSSLNIAAAHENAEAVRAILQHDALVPTFFISGNNPLALLTAKLAYPTSLDSWNLNYTIAKDLLNGANWAIEDFSIPLNSPEGTLEKVKAVGVKFYESDGHFPGLQDRKYSQLFACSEVRFLGFEFELKYPTQTQRLDFSYQATWKKINLEEIYTHKVNTYIDKGWDTSYYTQTYGNARYGAFWKPGLYSLEVKIAKRAVAKGFFIVY